MATLDYIQQNAGALVTYYELRPSVRNSEHGKATNINHRRKVGFSVCNAWVARSRRRHPQNRIMMGLESHNEQLTDAVGRDT
eukprot:1066646-Pleurochrysis_carterae.AAC.1